MKRLAAFLLWLLSGSAVATLPSSGQISMSQVNTELGFSSTANISLNDSVVRSLAAIPSGQISMDDLHGKTAPTVVNPLSIDARCAPTVLTSSYSCVVYFVDDGTMYGQANAAIGGVNAFYTSVPNEWYTPSPVFSIGSSYWAIATATTGTFSANSLSSCTSLSTGPSFAVAATTTLKSVTFTLQIYSNSGCTSLVMQTTGNVLSQDVSIH